MCSEFKFADVMEHFLVEINLIGSDKNMFRNVSDFFNFLQTLLSFILIQNYMPNLKLTLKNLKRICSYTNR